MPHRSFLISYSALGPFADSRHRPNLRAGLAGIPQDTDVVSYQRIIHRSSPLKLVDDTVYSLRPMRPYLPESHRSEFTETTVGFDKIKRGYKITCKGNWDTINSNVFNAAIFIGGMATESDVMDRVAAACQKIARKGSSSSKHPSLPNALKMDFFIATTNGNLPEVKRLLKKDSTLLNVRDEATDFCGLDMAVINGHEEVVEFLIQNGANVNATDFQGYTALHSAVKCGHKNIVRYLLDHKANVNATSKDGQTPLDLLPAGSPSIRYLLNKYGATNGSR